MVSNSSYVSIHDRGCGTGKSTRMIQELQKKPRSSKTLVILPLLTEVSRYLEALPWFKTPEEGRKEKDLLDLLVSGESIISTHALFSRLAGYAGQGLLRDYDIIIDEIPEIVREDSTVPASDFKQVYLGDGYVSVSEDGLVSPTLKWEMVKSEVVSSLRKEVFETAKAKCLYFIEDTFLLWAVPPALLTEGKSLTIMTFLGKDSVLTAYLRKMGIPYKIDEDDAGLQEFKRKTRELLTVKTIPSLEKLNFSCSTQTKAKGTKVSRALALLRTKGLKKVPHQDILVTCLKKNWFRKEGAEPGIYSKGSRLYESNWIPNTTRGTNKYKNCTHLVYLYNQYLNPYLKRWLDLDAEAENGYALSELIQWIYRSQIRDGKPVTLYIPSNRMRQLLVEFLGLTDILYQVE